MLCLLISNFISYKIYWLHSFILVNIQLVAKIELTTKVVRAKRIKNKYNNKVYITDMVLVSTLEHKALL